MSVCRSSWPRRRTTSWPAASTVTSRAPSSSFWAAGRVGFSGLPKSSGMGAVYPEVGTSTQAPVRLDS